LNDASILNHGRRKSGWIQELINFEISYQLEKK